MVWTTEKWARCVLSLWKQRYNLPVQYTSHLLLSKSCCKHQTLHACHTHSSGSDSNNYKALDSQVSYSTHGHSKLDMMMSLECNYKPPITVLNINNTHIFKKIAYFDSMLMERKIVMTSSS
jgi:hypothetical protein